MYVIQRKPGWYLETYSINQKETSLNEGRKLQHASFFSSKEKADMVAHLLGIKGYEVILIEEKKSLPVPTWKEVFNSNHITNIYGVREMAYNAQYPYFVWGVKVYRTGNIEDKFCLCEPIEPPLWNESDIK